MIGWVVLGSSLTLVIAFAVTTYYYRARARKAESKNTRWQIISPIQLYFTLNNTLVQLQFVPNRIRHKNFGHLVPTKERPSSGL